MTALVPKGSHLNLEGVMSRAVTLKPEAFQHRYNMGVPLKCRVERPGNGLPMLFLFTESGQGKQSLGSRWRGMRVKQCRSCPVGPRCLEMRREVMDTRYLDVLGHITPSAVAEVVHFYE